MPRLRREQGACLAFPKFVGMFFHGFIGIALLFAVLSLCACQGPVSAGGSASADDPADEPVQIRVGSLKGPTSIGLSGMLGGQTPVIGCDCEFNIYGSADELLPQLIQGKLDIALIPANVASVLYNKTEGGITVLNVNTLGVLYLLSADDSIKSLEDISGRTIYLTGKGTTPQYVTELLLDRAGLANDVKLEYKSEATELAALLKKDPSALCIIPEPYASSVIANNPQLKRLLSLSDEWDRCVGSSSRLVTGVTVVRDDFLLEQPQAVAAFISAQEQSIAWTVQNPELAAPVIVQAGIIANESLAKAAIPNCSLCCLQDDELRSALSGYLNCLYLQNSASIGAKLPQEDFYYSPQED